MDRVGFICNAHQRKVIRSNYSLYRAIPIANYLRQFNIELVVYSLRHVNPKTNMATGYSVESDRFVRKIFPVPDVNGNWFTGPDKTTLTDTLKLDEFAPWVKANHIYVYPPFEFCDFLRDKFKTYEFIDNHSHIPQPKTEIYKNKTQQIKDFLETFPRVFFKPLRGCKGDNIYVLKQTGNELSLHYYLNREMESFHFNDVDEIPEFLTHRIGKKPFVIQQGIDSPTLENRPFIFRTIMINDGEKWQWYHKAVVARHQSDIANTTQDSTNYFTQDLLNKIFSREKSAELLMNLKAISYDINDTLCNLYPNALIENAFDLMLDNQGKFYVVELNTQPGMTKPGIDGNFKFTNIFSPEKKEKKLYDTYVKPHGTYLGKFLKHKLEQFKQKESL